MISTEYTIDNLTITSVSIKTQRYYDGFALNQIHRKGYMNSEQGRAELQEEVPAAQFNAVIVVWDQSYKE